MSFTSHVHEMHVIQMSPSVRQYDGSFFVAKYGKLVSGWLYLEHIVFLVLLFWWKDYASL